MIQIRTILASMGTFFLVGSGCPAGPVGATGAPGAEGAHGKNALVATSVEAPGGSCGDVSGVQVTAGVDANSNGVLDPSEVDDTQTHYICDGEQGIPGRQAPDVGDRITALEEATPDLDDRLTELEDTALFRTAAATTALGVCFARGVLTANSVDAGVIPPGSNGDIACDRIANWERAPEREHRDWCCKSTVIVYPDGSSTGLGHNEMYTALPCSSTFSSSIEPAFAFACCIRGATCP